MDTEGTNTNGAGVDSSTPFAGCTILIVAVSVIIFLGVFSIYALFKQFSEISKFTSEEPAKIELVVVEDREAELNQLAEKLEAFRLSVSNEETVTLELDPEEMNLAIAAYEPLKDLRGTMQVLEINPENVRLGVSFQLNGKPRLPRKGESGLLASDPRYLNGVLVAKPGLLQGEVVLQLLDIEVEDADVPPEFIAQMSPYRIAERYVGSEGIGSAMGGLTAVELGDGVVRFIKEAGVIPADTITDQQVDLMGRKIFTFFGIAASLFLLFVGIVLVIGLRLRKVRGGES